MSHQPELVDLVSAARCGDHAAWTSLVDRFEGMLRAVARSHRLSPADVDDVVQTTWLRLLTRIGEVREPSAIGGWLATTARRESLRLLQSHVREHPAADDPDAVPDGYADGPEADLLAAERRAVLARALSTLPDRHRRLMTLLAAQPEPDYQQISATLAMPIGSIGPIRARSLARLHRHPELRSVRFGAA